MHRSKFFLLLLLGSLNLNAQWLADISSYSVYDNNIFSNYKNDGDIYFIPALHLSNIQENSEWFYDGSFIRMTQNTRYNSADHEAGVEFFPLLKGSPNRLILGAAGGIRQNDPDYHYRNYSEFKTYASAKMYPFMNTLTRFSASFKARRFPDDVSWNLSWDYNELDLYAQQNLFLSTGTTLRAGIQGIVRDFLPYNAVVDNVRYSGELPSLYQAVATLRVAQSISQQIGAYSEFLYRYNPSRSNPYEPEIMSFSPIDDYFGYSESSWKISVKYRILPSLSLSTTADTYSRSYKNRPVYLYDFDQQQFLLDSDGYYIPSGLSRQDRGYGISAACSWQLSSLFKSSNGLSLRLLYDLQSNSSNDAYFTYSKQSLALQLAVNFQH